MPEIAEVRITSEELQTLVGKKVTRIKYLHESFRIQIEEDCSLDPKSPGKIEYVGSYGKRLLFDFQDGTLVVALGMTGMFHTALEGEERENNKHDRIIFHLEGGERFYYNDIRMVGSSLTFVKQFERVGIDLLRGRCSQKLLREILQKHAQMNISSLLLNRQDYFPGIGNYLKSEILYHSRTSPFASCSEVNVRRLHLALHEVPRQAYREGGLTISTFYTPSGKKGLFRKQVYDEERCPKGHRITYLKQSGRGTYYCKKCQPG